MVGVQISNLQPCSAMVFGVGNQGMYFTKGSEIILGGQGTSRTVAP
jgi:hypothetical protein